MRQSTILSAALPTVHRFYKFFHQQIEWHICNELAHQNLNACYTTLSFIINHNRYFRLLPVFWHISQGSVATYLRCGGIFKWVCCKFVTECVSERIVKIGYYLGKLWVRFLVSFLLTHGVESPTRARTDRFSDIIADRCNIKATAVFRRYFFHFYRSSNDRRLVSVCPPVCHKSEFY